jgi:hypothetical protein
MMERGNPIWGKPSVWLRGRYILQSDHGSGLTVLGRLNVGHG